jgi:hypothetical protein
VSSNPFESPAQIEPEPISQPFAPVQEGSLGLGVALGFILGLWGWLGCLIFAKPLTKKGAGYGFLGRIGITVVAVLIMFAIQ